MKKHLFFKKSLLLFMLLLGFAFMIAASEAKATNYSLVFWDNYSSNQSAPYCSCDSIKCVPPTGVNTITWVVFPVVDRVYHGDTLVLLAGFNGGVACSYNGGSKNIYLRPTTAPISPGFPLADTVCGIGQIILDAANYNQYGFNIYTWNTGVHTQSINVGVGGNYNVTISNTCGTISDTIIIVQYNPNKPNLGSDIAVCQGTTVILNPGTGYSNYLWMPGASHNSFLIPTTSGTYIVQTTNAVGGCVDMDTIQVTFFTPPTKQICYAGFDTVSFKNNIYLPTSSSANIESYNIYKEVSLGVWNLIGNAPSDSSYFTDVNCNPQAQSYSYQIAVVDTCGNEGARSATHTTITLLSTYDQLSDTYGFTWSAYAGLTVSDYYLYGINTSETNTLIGTVNGNQYFYNYVNPSSTYVKYFVGFTGPNCNAKSDNLVKSNYVQSVTGINEANLTDNSISISPNPVTDLLQIQTTETIKNIEIMDATGRLMMATDQQAIDCNALSNGIYFIRIITGKGEYKNKFVISH